MNTIEQALWYIEAHLTTPFSLEKAAKAAGVSRWHLSRSFGFALGIPITAYLRERRLTEAARRLANGHNDICALALDFGYGSHEAFTRAFRSKFNITPEQLRAAGTLDTLTVLEPITMNDFSHIDLEISEIKEFGPTLVAGLSGYFKFSDRGAIPGLWQNFMPLMMQIPDIRPGTTYGIIKGDLHDNDGFEYTAAIEIRTRDEAPAGLKTETLPAQKIAIFRYPGHVADIGAVCSSVLADWNKRTDETPSEGPIHLIEYYPPSFNAMTGDGGFEIWVPLKSTT